MRKILVVDDEQEIRELLGKMLGKNQFSVTTAQNGEEALSICAVNKPDLILLDIVMPGMDGYEVSRRLKSSPETRDIPVVFITGKEMPAEAIIELYNKKGAAAYIAKPYEFEDLLVKVKKLI